VDRRTSDDWLKSLTHVPREELWSHLLEDITNCNTKEQFNELSDKTRLLHFIAAKIGKGEKLTFNGRVFDVANMPKAKLGMLLKYNDSTINAALKLELIAAVLRRFQFGALPLISDDAVESKNAALPTTSTADSSIDETKIESADASDPSSQNATTTASAPDAASTIPDTRPFVGGTFSNETSSDIQQEDKQSIGVRLVQIFRGGTVSPDGILGGKHDLKLNFFDEAIECLNYRQNVTAIDIVFLIPNGKEFAGFGKLVFLAEMAKMRCWTRVNLRVLTFKRQSNLYQHIRQPDC